MGSPAACLARAIPLPVRTWAARLAAAPARAGRRLRRAGTSLRYRLLALVLLPIVLVAPVTVGFVIVWSQQFGAEQLVRRVSTDLGVAHESFSRLQGDYLARLRRVADSHAFYTAFEAGDVARMAEQMATLRETAGFDFVHVTDPAGRDLLVAPGEVGEHGAPLTPLFQQAARWGAPSVGLEVFGPGQLAEVRGALAERAALPEPRAGDEAPGAERRGLVVRAVTPVRNPQGVLVALLDGGVLLNRSVELVDAVRDLVYGPGSLPVGARGVASILLDDVRVSTNARRADRQRDVGSRAPAGVREAVLARGEVWVGRSRLGDEWTISAYEPLADSFGRRVGMLHVGFTEGPFRAAYRRTLWLSLALLGAGAALTVALAVRAAGAIFGPVERMASAARAVRAGDEGARVGALRGARELAELARQFDRTLDRLAEHNREARRAADRLEREVAERTRELRERNARLEETIAQLHAARQQLVVAEKLAALGELTAGVAHEINNPLAVIQGNLELLRATLGEALAPFEVEIGLMMEQLDRIRGIVDKLLHRARQGRLPAEPCSVDVGELVDDTLPLVGHELDARGVSVAVRDRATRPAWVDRGELAQVLVNLLVNAAQASPSGGRIEVTVADAGPDAVAVVVRDRGEGIPAEHLARVFDPFFTTKRAGGTGLGLSVSYGLVRRNRGEIAVRSRPGEGAEFEVTVPAAPAEARAARS